MIPAAYRYCFLSFTLLFVVYSCGNTPGKLESQNEVQELVKTPVAPKLLRHVVLFKFNKNATPAIVEKIETEFAALPSKISEIHSFEWGLNNSPEGLNKGLTHCFLVSFLSEEGRDKYIPHPAHKEFVDLIGPYVEDVTVVDYWVK